MGQIQYETIRSTQSKKRRLDPQPPMYRAVVVVLHFHRSDCDDDGDDDDMRDRSANVDDFSYFRY